MISYPFAGMAGMNVPIIMASNALSCRQIYRYRYDSILSGSSRSHYDDVIMSAMASQITSLTNVYSTVNSGVDQRKHQSCASLAFVRGIHRWPVIPRPKAQKRRKCFHLMTSSCWPEGFAQYGIWRIQGCQRLGSIHIAFVPNNSACFILENKWLNDKIIIGD